VHFEALRLLKKTQVDGRSTMLKWNAIRSIEKHETLKHPTLTLIEVLLTKKQHDVQTEEKVSNHGC
jgi:hypothetical protein